MLYALLVGGVIVSGCGAPPSLIADTAPSASTPSASTEPVVTASPPGSESSVPPPKPSEPVPGVQSADPIPTTRIAVLAPGVGHDVWAVVEDCGEERCHAAIERSVDDGKWSVQYRFERSPWRGTQPSLVVASAQDIWAHLGGDWEGVVSHDGGASWHIGDLIFSDQLTSVRGEVWGLQGGAHINGHGSTVGHAASSADGLTPVASPPIALAGGTQEVLVVSDTGTLFAAGSGIGGVWLDVSVDSGASWQERPVPCAKDRDWRSLDWAAGALWLVCAGEPTAGLQRKSSYRSLDDGRTWTAEAPLEAYAYATNIVAVDARVAWRFGFRAPLYRTADGGATWSPLLGELFGDAGGGFTPDIAVAGPDGSLLVSWRGRVLRVDRNGQVRSSDTVSPAEEPLSR